MKKGGKHYKKAGKSFQTDASIFNEGKFFRGVLVSCQKNQEKFAVRDAYRVLNDNFERMFGEKQTAAADRTVEEQIRANLESGEKVEVKVHAAKARLFNQVRVEATGLVFIRFDEELFPKHVTVKAFVDEIFLQASATGQVPSKWVH